MENSLNDFSWGSSDSSIEQDFFSMSNEDTEIKTDVESVIQEIEKDETQLEDKEVKNENKGLDLFSDSTEIENIENSNTDDDESDDVILGKNPNLYLLEKLKEKGIIEFELEDGEELTDEEAEEVLIDKFDESVENKIKELMTELPDEKKQVVQFLLKGGNLEDLVGSYTADTSIDINTDLEKEENQIKLMKQMLKSEDKDEEEIEAEIEFLKDSGKLKLMAEKKLNKYKVDFESKQKEVIKKQQESIEAEREVIKEAKTSLSTFLNSTEEINGIKFNKEDKKVLPSFMNDKTVKLQNGTKITEMQKQMFYDLPKNEKAMIQLATLLRNRNEDGTFNFDNIAKESETKVTQKVRQEIRRDKKSIPGSSISKGNTSNKSLAEYF